MTPIQRLSSLYFVTLLVSVAVIMSVLRFGSAQPSLPSETPAAVENAAIAAPSETALSALGSDLRTNFSNPLSRLLVQILLVIALGGLVSRLCKWIGQPAVVGEIVAGILLGPSLLGLLAPEAFAFIFRADSLAPLRLLSQVGVCLFMFVVGMELDVTQLRKNTHSAIAVSHVSIAFPFLLGVVLAYFLYAGYAGSGTTFTSFALFMGISMSITAFPVLARILEERGISRTFLGCTAITSAAIDDVTAWTILAFVVAIVGATSLAGIALKVLLLLAFIAIMMFSVRPALPRLLGRARLAQEDPSNETLAIVICLLVAASLVTEVIGIHVLFGAFLAGAVMPNVKGLRHGVGRRIQALSSVLLLPLFFAFTGLRTEISLLHDLDGWLMVLAITALATLGKLGGSAMAARFTGMPWGESLQLGALMNTRGLMELIALNIGYDLGILSPRIFTMLVIMAVLTTMLTGPLLTLFGGKHLADNDRT